MAMVGYVTVSMLVGALSGPCLITDAGDHLRVEPLQFIPVPEGESSGRRCSPLSSAPIPAAAGIETSNEINSSHRRASA
jgi:hypothetical protein